VNGAAAYLQQSVHEDATILWGQGIDPALADQVRITVVATGVRKQDA
jgi:cell division GTPase FtsZ